jgi:hypothetical protein
MENGAEEVWICTVAGRLRFYNDGGELAESALVPGFPRRI